MTPLKRISEAIIIKKEYFLQTHHSSRGRLVQFILIFFYNLGAQCHFLKSSITNPILPYLKGVSVIYPKIYLKNNFVRKHFCLTNQKPILIQCSNIQLNFASGQFFFFFNEKVKSENLRLISIGDRLN